MSGIYIHIPFCLSKCAYCGFYSKPSLKQKDVFREALGREIVSRKDYLHGEPVETVYFGGGTPSLLMVDEIGALLDLIKKHYELAPDPEITLEANPDTLSLEYLKGLRALGVNRLSIGIQSFFDNDLKYLSRRHDSQHARQCVKMAKDTGFENISIDLIYGLPTSDADQWNKNLDLFFGMNVPHLSAYALTLEPNSILTKQIELGKALPVNEEDAVRDYEILCRRAVENGFCITRSPIFASHSTNPDIIPPIGVIFHTRVSALRPIRSTASRGSGIALVWIGIIKKSNPNR